MHQTDVKRNRFRVLMFVLILLIGGLTIFANGGTQLPPHVLRLLGLAEARNPQTPLDTSVETITDYFETNQKVFRFKERNDIAESRNDSFDTILGTSVQEAQYPALIAIVHDSDSANDDVHIVSLVWGGPTRQAYFFGVTHMRWLAEEITGDIEAFDEYMQEQFNESRFAPGNQYRSTGYVNGVRVDLLVVKNQRVIAVKFISVTYETNYMSNNEG